MPTRFYLPSSGTAPASPAPGSAWEQTATMARRPLVTTVTNTAIPTTGASLTPSGTTLADHLAAQYVSAPLSAQTVSGTMSLVVAGLQAGATMNAYLQVVARVVSGGGTERGVLYAGQTASTGSTVATDPNYRLAVASEALPASRTRILTVAVAPVVALAGDRVVVEVGARAILPNGSSRTYAVYFGDPTGSTDYPSTVDLAGNTGRPWVEFSADLFAVGIQDAARRKVIKVKAADGTWKPLQPGSGMP